MTTFGWICTTPSTARCVSAMGCDKGSQKSNGISGYNGRTTSLSPKLRNGWSMSRYRIGKQHVETGFIESSTCQSLGNMCGTSFRSTVDTTTPLNYGIFFPIQLCWIKTSYVKVFMVRLSVITRYLWGPWIFCLTNPNTLVSDDPSTFLAYTILTLSLL